MDVLVCNGLGIYCGMKTLGWLSMKPYQWQGLWNIPTYKYIYQHFLWKMFCSILLVHEFTNSSCYRGKIKRIAFQFTPYSWAKFEWRPASSLRRWLAVLGIIFMVSHAAGAFHHCKMIWFEIKSPFFCSSCWRSWTRFIWSLCCGCLQSITWCFYGWSSS